MDALERLAIKQLDENTKKFRESLVISPKNGWIKCIRKTLKLSTYKLASLLGISQPSLSMIEKREELKSVTLETLEKIAHVLDCKFVYGFVPHSSFEDFITKKAEIIARQKVINTQNTMSLENQSLNPQQLNDQIQLIKNDLLSKPLKELWNLYEI